MTTKTTAYVSMRGTRSRRQVSRDASPLTANSTMPFAALVLGHPDGTATRFELSYREQALRETGEAGFLVDLTQKQSTAESVTLCRIFVPADGKSEPKPSYPKLAADVRACSALEAPLSFSRAEIVNGTGWAKEARFVLVDATRAERKPRFKPGHKRAGDGYIRCSDPSCCPPYQRPAVCTACEAKLSSTGPCPECGAEEEHVAIDRTESFDVPSVSTADASEAFEGRRS